MLAFSFSFIFTCGEEALPPPVHLVRSVDLDRLVLHQGLGAPPLALQGVRVDGLRVAVHQVVVRGGHDRHRDAGLETNKE